jgi:MFS family permease
MTEKAPLPPASLWKFVAVSIFCSVVVVVFARLAYGLVLPSMQADLSLSFTQAALLGTVTALGYLSLVLPAGLFAARFGASRAILLGTVFAVGGFAGLTVASAYPLLILLMLLLGAATAFAYTPMISLLGSWFPERRGTVIGLANSGVGSGMFLTGAFVPLLTESGHDNGWRLVWASFAAMALVCATLVFWVLRDPPRATPDATQSARKGGIASAYKNPHVLTVAWIYGIVGVTYILQSLFMYSFALDTGISPTNAGRLVAMMGILSIFASPSWGWAADRIGHAQALMICMALAMFGTLLPVAWPVLPAFALHYLLLGVSTTGQFTSILAAATRTVSREQAAVTISFVTLFFAAGQLIGPSAAGVLLEQTGDFRLLFLLSSALLGFGIFMSWKSAARQ